MELNIEKTLSLFFVFYLAIDKLITVNEQYHFFSLLGYSIIVCSIWFGIKFHR